LIFTGHSWESLTGYVMPKNESSINIIRMCRRDSFHRDDGTHLQIKAQSQALSRPILRLLTYKDYSMKERRIVASSSPVTTIRVQGQDRHFFHSRTLGKCRAVLIAPDENLPSPYATGPLTKGEKLEALLDCADRLSRRYWAAYTVYEMLPDTDAKGRREIFNRMERIHLASNRVTRLIKTLLTESQGA
jgi:hypothetical protein